MATLTEVWPRIVVTRPSTSRRHGSALEVRGRGVATAILEELGCSGGEGGSDAGVSRINNNTIPVERRGIHNNKSFRSGKFGCHTYISHRETIG